MSKTTMLVHANGQVFTLRDEEWKMFTGLVTKRYGESATMLDLSVKAAEGTAMDAKRRCPLSVFTRLSKHQRYLAFVLGLFLYLVVASQVSFLLP